MISPSRRTASALLLTLLGAFLFSLILARSGRLLFINLGPGDEPFARGFRGGWERDGPRGEGVTAFRWTEDGARLEAPLHVKGSLRARLRVARFTRTPAEIRLVGNGRTLAEWTQHPLGWRIREIELGEWDGPLVLQFRSQAPDDDPLGVALDWVEVSGASRARPEAGVVWRIALLLLGVPLAVWMLTRSPPTAAAFAAGLAALAALAAWLDRLGGSVALASAALPALSVTAAVGLAGAVASRRFPGLCDARALVVPWAGALVALIALSHPFFHYPDVDTHAKLVDALDEQPSLALDPRPYQANTGAWTRGIDGRRVPFPYSPAFHVLAWPVAKAVGPVAAVKTVAVAALALTLLLTHVLARAVGLTPAWCVAAQAVLCLLPVTASRLTLALYPTLLAQALELGLLLAIARALPVAAGRAALPVALCLAAVQAAYTGSLLSLPVVVACVAWSETRQGARASALRLVAAWAVSAAFVVAIQYRSFLPVLWHDVLPHASSAAGEREGPAVAAALRRVAIFFDHVHPGLALLGLLALRGAARVRRVWRASIAAGLVLLVLRYALPALFRDAKEVELLAAPVAVAMGAGWAWLWPRAWGRAATLASAAWVVGWGAWRAWAVYAERFVALQR